MSSTAYRTTNEHLSRAMASAPRNLPYTEARRHHALVRHEPSRGLVAVLLRPGEPATTLDALRAIGFRSEFPTDLAASTWVGDLGHDLALLHDALGPDSLFDLGPVFHDVSETLARAPVRWPGRFVIHVGGTQRCLVFEDAGRRDLEPIVQRGIEEYFVTEWAPTTE